MTGRRARGNSTQILGRALLSGAAIGGLMIGLLGATAPAQAEIGLAPGGRGSAYITFQGGYQQRNGAAAVAPAGPTNTNAFGSSHVEAQAIATPDQVSAKARVTETNRSAEANASATPNSVTTETSASQQFGDEQGKVEGKAAATTGAQLELDASLLAQDPPDLAAIEASVAADATPSSSVSVSQRSENAGITVTVINTSTSPVSVNAEMVNVAVADDVASVGVQSAEADEDSAVATNTAENTIGPNTAAAVGIAVTEPESQVVTATAALDDEGLGSVAVYDRQMHAPFVGFQSNQGPIVFDPSNETLEADDGAFGGFSFGYVFVGPVLGVIDRFEAYGTHSRNEDDEIKQSQAFTGVSADGQAIVTAINTKGLQIETDETLTQTEFGMRFKSDRLAHGVLPLIVSLEPFYMNYEQESGYGLADVVMFESTVEADLWGGQLALESEIPLFGEAISWVGRVSGGFYWMDADGDFSNSLTGRTLSLGTDETGYRLGAETGLRLFLGPHAFLTGTGAVDHLSEAPRAVYRGGLGPLEEVFRTATADPARVESDELTNYRANLRLTFTTRSHEPVAFK